MKPTFYAAVFAFFGCLLYGGPGNYRVETVAGSSNVGDGGAAIHASFRDAEGVAVDRAGNVYVADAGDHRVRKITPAGTITTVAGTGFAGFSGDNGPASEAQLNLPYGISLDGAGNLFIADLGNDIVRKVAVNGVITSLATKFKSPRNVLADGAGNLYVSEFGANRVRRINNDGSVVTIAGTGTAGNTGDFGPALLATINSPAGLALDSAGALYIADTNNASIRRVAGGTITTVLGTGVAGMGSAMQLSLPTGVAFDPFGNLYVADAGNKRVRKLSASNTVSTVPQAARDLTVDSSGNLVIAAKDYLTKVLVSGAVAIIAGDGSYFFRGDGGRATEARLNQPTAIAVEVAGTLSIADTGNSRVRHVSASGTIATLSASPVVAAPAALSWNASRSLLVADASKAIVGILETAGLTRIAGGTNTGYAGDGTPANLASLWRPTGLATRPDGGYYIADTGNSRIRFVNPGGSISTVAGNGDSGWNGDGIALGAKLSEPTALALDGAGSLYIADTFNNAVRKLTSDGQLITVIRTGSLTLSRPRGLAFDPSGTLWIADTGNHRILAMTSDGTVRIMAGLGAPGFSGDGGDALNAKFSEPSGLASDAFGNIYVADTGNDRIRVLRAPPPAVTENGGTSYSAVNAASLLGGVAAPCSLLTIFGSNQFVMPPLFFDGVPAVSVSSAAGQVTVQVPCSATPPSSTLAIGDTKTVVPIALAAPALFALNAGAGQALALNGDGTPNSESNPASSGSVVSLFATGMGVASNPVGALIGNSAATIIFSGDAPGFIGITQINVQLPSAISGVQPVFLLSANVPSQNSVTIAIQ